ncbi:hypothetical protein VNO78_30620 [Psophocarpus tetragonolobus]|uniref:Uncharacterized protein n=1 Tax=Psophocarpus tetragonolobus TaxID=3891 RepID=A0AAN9RX38_PSOTE
MSSSESLGFSSGKVESSLDGLFGGSMVEREVEGMSEGSKTEPSLRSLSLPNDAEFERMLENPFVDLDEGMLIGSVRGMPRRGQMVYHFHKERVTRLDHYRVTPEAPFLWNAKLTSAQVMSDDRLLSKEDRDLMEFAGSRELASLKTRVHETTEEQAPWNRDSYNTTSLTTNHEAMKLLIVIPVGVGTYY